MVLDYINISQFRNYDSLKVFLNHGINIIYGKNAQGKTNLLESIYVLALTKSHRSFIDKNLIKMGKKKCKIDGLILENNIPTHLEVTIQPNQKKIKIDNNDIKKMSDYISKMNIIIFYPEDLELVKGSPGVRRRFLNLEISQLYSNYLGILSEYNKILKMRNDYLKKINSGLQYDESYFEILNKYFIEKSAIIYRYRYEFIKELNNKCSSIFKNLSGLDDFCIKYNNYLDFSSLEMSGLMDQIKNKINKLKSAEFKLGVSLTGPHRDDFEFLLENKNIKNYGSQGQQRMAVLAVKLAEISIVKDKSGKTPILLLDDVFSELDNQKKNNLLTYIKNDIQTIITTTDLKNIDDSILKSAKLIKIEAGKIISEQGEE